MAELKQHLRDQHRCHRFNIVDTEFGVAQEFLHRWAVFRIGCHPDLRSDGNSISIELIGCSQTRLKTLRDSHIGIAIINPWDSKSEAVTPES